MTEMFRRISGVCGLTFVVVFVIANVASGEPSRTATKEEITKFLSGHQTSNEVFGALAMLISGVFAIFAVGLWTLLRTSQRNGDRAWPATAFVGGIVMAVELALLGASIGALGRLGDSLSTQPILAQTIFTSYQMVSTSILPFIALFLLGIGMATLESRAFPTWTAWLAFLGAALNVVLVVQSLWPGPVLDGIGIVQALVSIGYIAIISIYMLLPQRQPVAFGAPASGAAQAR
jgi:Zn-dependent protease